MKKINLKWDTDGTIESYSVYRSETRINSSSLPSPLATGLQRRSYEDIYEGDAPILYYKISSIVGRVEKTSSEIIVNLHSSTDTDTPFTISCDGATSEIVVSPFSSDALYEITVDGVVRGTSYMYSSGGMKEDLALINISMDGFDSNGNLTTGSVDNPVAKVRFKNLDSTNKRIMIRSKEESKITQSLTPENVTFGVNGTDNKQVTFCLSGYVQEVRDFDYAVLRYIWTDTGGRDLDTRTSITNPMRNVHVGWGRNDYDDNYLTWGGDNTGSGVESILLNIIALKGTYPLQTTFEVMLRSFWYSSKVTGDFKVQFESFKGGTMTKNGYDFINSGGISVQTVTIDCHTDTVNGSNIDGDLVATLTYDSRLNTGTLVSARG